MRVYCDSINGGQYGLQDPATPIAEGIVRFHHDLMVVMIFVVVFVGWMLGRGLYHFNKESGNVIADRVVHGTVIEIVWTIIPAVILTIVAVPSFTLLYAVEEVVEPAMTLKVVGHQWYWSYEYTDPDMEEELEFESYMVPDEDLALGEVRLLEVDNRIALPAETHVRLIVTSGDVLHCWTVPSFGVKIDACPGRLNEVSVYVKRPGVYFGQCSELCGVNHSFMPIGVEVLPMEEYLEWRSEG